MNWVFCNKCSLKFNPKIKFYLSECGHIFCQTCELKYKLRETKQCVICNKSGSFMELSKEMDHTTQMFFWPLENMIEQSLKVFNFQSMHKSLFMQSLTKKYHYAKNECISYYNANKKLQKENQLMREILKRNGFDVAPFITSTPSKSQSDQGYDHNLSMLSSIRFTPVCVPGSAQRMYYANRKLGQPSNPPSRDSSAHGPSPSQQVPQGYLAPVHREPTMTNPAASTPTYMDKLRLKSGYYPLRCPKK